jgi:hypothetical protein
MGVEKAQLEEKPVRIMKIHSLNIDLLKPHEALDPEESRLLIESIEEKGVFYKPMLVARDSLVILDGHHRWDGLKRLGAKTIPSILLDYFDDEIKLYTWYPILDEPFEIVEEFFDWTPLKGYEKYLTQYPFIVTDGERYHGLETENAIHDIEESGCTFSYVDTIGTALKEAKSDKTVFLRRAPTKKEVIERASRNEVFPPKTTRHWFPYKYPYIYIKKEELI